MYVCVCVFFEIVERLGFDKGCCGLRRDISLLLTLMAEDDISRENGMLEYIYIYIYIYTLVFTRVTEGTLTCCWCLVNVL